MQRKLRYFLFFVGCSIFCRAGVLFCYWYGEQKTSIVSRVQDDGKKSNAQSLSTTRMLAVSNGITKEMLHYSHWSGDYVPTVFRLQIDGILLERGKTYQFPVDNRGTLIVRYDYSFLYGYRSGARLISFQIPPHMKSVVVRFSWNEALRLLLDDIKGKEEGVVPFDETCRELL